MGVFDTLSLLQSMSSSECALVFSVCLVNVSVAVDVIPVICGRGDDLSYCGSTRFTIRKMENAPISNAFHLHKFDFVMFGERFAISFDFLCFLRLRSLCTRSPMCFALGFSEAKRFQRSVVCNFMYIPFAC